MTWSRPSVADHCDGESAKGSTDDCAENGQLMITANYGF